MKTRLELTPQERYDIVSYRIENAQKTLDEIENLVALKYYNTAANRMYYACYYAVCALLIAISLTRSHTTGQNRCSAFISSRPASCLCI